MNTSTFSSSPAPAADEQASLWAVRLEGSPLTASDHAALQAWLAENPGHAERLAEYRQLAFDLDQQLPALAKSGRVAFPTEPARALERRPRRGSWIMALAGAGAAALFAAALWQHRAALPEVILAPNGARRSFTLADGTQVELNAATRLEIEKSAGERRVRLEDGEAYFHVAQDRSRPFIVETRAGSVRVLGTAFDVRSEAPGQLEVTVLEGSVSVQPMASVTTPLGQALTLKAGDRWSETKDGGVTFGAIANDAILRSLAWRQGKAMFVDAPLKEALECFARYHSQKLTVSDSAAAEKVGGVYHLDDLDPFLAGLETGLHLKVSRAADGSVKITRDTEP
jgi:transmembrane sensor